MGTLFSEVIDLALVSIQDYKLNKLYQDNITGWYNFVNGILIKATCDFEDCLQSLEYDITTPSGAYFISTLTAQEIDILASWFVYEWFDRQVNNITQIDLSPQSPDFKRYAESQNLKEKSEYRDRSREIVMQKMTRYGYKNNSKWGDWANGNFGI